MNHADLRLGIVFTPLSLAQNLVRRFGLAERWKAGATLMDPTCGDGVWFQALVNEAVLSGWTPVARDFERLYGVERDKAVFQLLKNRFAQQGWPFLATNFVHQDFLSASNLPRVDIGLGNPPWVGFSALPDHEKELWKPLYRQLDLIPDARAALAGAAQVDLAALVTAYFLTNCWTQQGPTVFVLPRSLAVSAAHRPFRQHYSATLWEKLPQAFPTVGTSAGLGVWGQSSPSEPTPDKACIEPITKSYENPEKLFDPVLAIPVPPLSLPRQGINTQGCNDVFFFETKPEHIEETLLHPVPVAANWQPHREGQIQRWVLLPYDRKGRLLGPQELSTNFPRAWAYLCSQQERLRQRRGTLIRKRINKGDWYALWGVGPYTFQPWKIVWPAYGHKRFTPVLLGPQVWVPQQALQGYCAFSSRREAQRVFRSLAKLPVEETLTAWEGAGTPSWAQPGKMRHFFVVREQSIPRDRSSGPKSGRIRARD